MKNPRPFRRRGDTRTAGFTLLEMLIALGLFLIISSAAFSLFSQHQPMFKQQQNLAGLNISLRNAVSQIQLDTVNGGAGYYQGMNVPNWPVGVVISNNVVATSGDCRTGTPKVYDTNCFDSFVSIVADPSTKPVNPLAGASGTLPVAPNTCASTTTNTSTSHQIFMLPPTGVTAATYAANFHNGDQILLEKGDGSAYTTVKLTAAGATQVVSGTTYVLLTHGVFTQGSGQNSASDDQTGMSVNSASLTTSQFCATDWVIRLIPVKYDVDLSTPSNPALRRTVLVGGNAPAAGVGIVSEQIIGFKVGASTHNNCNDTDTTTYNFDASQYQTCVGGVSSTDAYDYTLVRSVMISIVGRTPPQTDPTYTFRNAFDGGAYETQGVSVVVNPRNMSMTD